MATKTRSTRKGHGDSAVARFTSSPAMHGEVITWNVGDKAHSHREVLDALIAATLAADDDAATEVANQAYPSERILRLTRMLQRSRTRTRKRRSRSQYPAQRPVQKLPV